MPILSPRPPARTKENYLDMKHGSLYSHFRNAKTQKKTSKGIHKISDFLEKHSLAWAYYTIRNNFGCNHRFQTYTNGKTGIYTDKNFTVAITADWGTDTEESIDISKQMADKQPDYSIHLGDTYFVGAPQEIESNFLAPDSPWHRGKKGSFALLGNHEMYARGIAYFRDLLPSMGLYNTTTKKYEGQDASFFCIENSHWRILGIDTGYNSTTKIPLVDGRCTLERKMMKWLRDVVKLNNVDDKRGILFLMHHQCITAFKKEGEYTKPARQLAKLIGQDRPVLWICGHEHKLSAFSKTQIKDGVTAYVRCIGHGGMPVELKNENFTFCNSKIGRNSLVIVDRRVKNHKEQLGHNGYVVLQAKDDEMEISYHDEKDLLFKETWKADLTSGLITGAIKAASINIEKCLLEMSGKQLTDAVK